MCPRDYTPALLRWVDKENLPTFLGGTSNATLLDDAGPWNNRDIIAEVEEEHRRAAHLVSDDDCTLVFVGFVGFVVGGVCGIGHDEVFLAD